MGSPLHRAHLTHLAHLARRFVGSWSRRPLSGDDALLVSSVLDERLAALFWALPPADQRHAVEVTRRFAARRPAATREELAGALLHDVGKQAADLGTLGRVVATLVGPRTDRFSAYHDHERIGAELVRRAGGDAVTVALITGSGPAAADLRAADDSI